jgi:hypothetical protein
MKTGSEKLGKAIAVVFTTLVAPIFVHFAVLEIQAARAGSVGHSKSAAVDGPREIVVSEGMGATPSEARLNAERRALQRVIADHADPSMTAAQLAALCESVMAVPETILLRQEVRSCRAVQSSPGGGFRAELMIEIALVPLKSRLHQVQ